MVRFLSLSSGSNANCYYLGNGKRGLLIDIGVGVRTLKKRLAEHDISFDNIDMVLVTHDHIDHIRSLGSFTQRHQKPVFATETLHKALSTHFCTRDSLSGCVNILEEDLCFKSGEIEITTFAVPHDASQTLGYHIVFDGVRFTFLTDIGYPTEVAIKYASMANHLIVEANYDIDMLLSGPYPQSLKMRILEDTGHLSNDQTASLVRRAFHSELKSIHLAHLSRYNNTPKLAFQTVSDALCELGVRVGEDVILNCLPRTDSSEMMECS